MKLYFDSFFKFKLPSKRFLPSSFEALNLHIDPEAVCLGEYLQSIVGSHFAKLGQQRAIGSGEVFEEGLKILRASGRYLAKEAAIRFTE